MGTGFAVTSAQMLRRPAFDLTEFSFKQSPVVHI